MKNLLEKFNTAETWIDVDILAKLKGVSKRAIRLSFNSKNSKYETKIEKGKGGKLYKIRLSSIEEDLQLKYIHEYYDTLTTTNNIVELHNFQTKKEQIISFKQRKMALAKYDLVRIWNNYRLEEKQKGVSKKVADSEFLTTYNTGLLYSKIFNALGKISIGALYRWKALLEDKNDWTVLIGNYNYTANGCYRTSLSENEIKIFLNILLSPNKFSIGRAITLTQYILKERNAENIPTEVTFRRYAKWYRANNLDKWTLAREGMKALKDKVEPYIVRDTSMLKVGQVLVADGHALNFQVINPFTGKLSRATLIGFLDWKSGGLVGYDIMLEENTQCIASALRNSIINLNMIPKIVYQNNGRAFRAKYFTDDKGFTELGFQGLYSKLGIETVFARPYNARAKVIERFFKEFQESFEKLLPSYVGSNIQNKPAYMMRNEKLHKQIHNDFVPTLDETIKMIDMWLNFKISQPCPNEPNKTIAEVLESRKSQNIDINLLDDLMLATEVKTIQRNGIRFLNCDYFDERLYGFKSKVLIKYNLFDLTSIKVYTTKGEYLCTAGRVTETHPMAKLLGTVTDFEDYKQKIVKQRKLHKKTINSVKAYLTNDETKFLETKMLEENSNSVQTEFKVRSKGV